MSSFGTQDGQVEGLVLDPSKVLGLVLCDLDSVTRSRELVLGTQLTALRLTASMYCRSLDLIIWGSKLGIS